MDEIVEDEITVIAFNYGNAGRYVNGPGMCLVNFVKNLKKCGVKVNVFTKMNSNFPGTIPLTNLSELRSAIKRSFVLHHWSGMGLLFEYAVNLANKQEYIKVLIGPNVIDTVSFDLESSYLSKVRYDHILTANEHLKFKIAREHKIPLDKMGVLMIGPDRDLWAPIEEDNGKILWKGNSKQSVKDIKFALEVQKAMPEYEFEFIGYPKPYDYMSHIKSAKSCHLYFSTSLSETMGLGLAEQFCAGIPSVTHPKIHLNGENYRTGIITNRTVPDYCAAIREIMEDDALYRSLSKGAIEFSWKKFIANFSGVTGGYLYEYCV